MNLGKSINLLYVMREMEDTVTGNVGFIVFEGEKAGVLQSNIILE